MENNEITTDERTIIDDLVQKAVEGQAEKVTERKFTELVSAQNAEVGNDLCPTWARHAGMFLNAVALNGNGDTSAAVQRAEKYVQARSAMSAAAVAHEDREALRIIRSASKLTKDQQIRVQNTTVNAEGKFLLPKPFLAEIFVTLEEYGVARRTFRGVPMVNKTIDLKDIATKPVVAWEDENAKIAKTSIAFGEKQLTAKKLAALLPWTMEFQEDEVFGFLNLASQLFAEQLAFKEDSAGFVGGGGSDTGNGGFVGMLNLVNAVVYNLGGSNGSGKTTYDSLTADDLNIAKRSLSLAKQRGARWFMHQSVLGVIERLKDKEEQYIYRAPGMGLPATLWGDPVELVEVMPKTADGDQAGSRFIAYGNPANMLFGSRRGVTFDIGREGVIFGENVAGSYSAFQQDGAILRVTERIAFQTPLDANFAVLKTAAS